MSLNIVVNADVAAAGRQIQDFSKQSRIALTNLSLVAQDLPFGFIGIQNNLPGVIQSFGALRAETGSTVGAFKALGAGLVGPAGIFLAFSAVTSAITYAIQKYGSLTNAVNALTSSNAAAVIAQNTFNKELNEGINNTTTESIKIGILTKTLSDLSRPLKDRQDAYAELKKIQPDIVRGISEENALTATGIELINNNAKARLEYIKLKVQENAITAVLNQNGAKQLELESKVLSTARDLAATREKIFRLQEQALSESQQRTLDVLIQKEKSQASALKGVTIEYNNLNAVNDTYISKLETALQGISSYDRKTQELIQTLKDQAKAAREVTGIGNVYEGVIGEARTITDDTVLAKVFAANRRIQVNSIRELIKARRDDARDQIAKTKLTPKKVEGIGKTILFSEDIYKQFTALDELVRKFEETKQQLSTIFFDPLTNLFENFFETGKLSFQAFGDAVLKQIKRIVAKIIATGIIRLLASILFPQGAAGSAAATAASTFGTIIQSAFSSAGVGGGISNPSFSGITGGGLAMNGQVNLLLRGSDLVGALNRTNSTINRVG